MTNSTVPIISCVIPVHNGKRDLQRAVDSVLAQSTATQVILVDDCSTDGSAELVLAMAAAEPRIEAVTLPKNRGQGYARNVGVAVAQAPYITFLDQDDEHLPGWYAHGVEVLELNPGLAAVKGDVELIDIPFGASVIRGDARWRAIVNSPIWNVIMRSVIYSVLGGCPASPEYRTREGNEDVALITALVRNCQMMGSSHPATRHYVQPDGATAYFLRRTKLVENRIEYIEITEHERTAAVAGAANAYQVRSDSNLEAIRAMLMPHAKTKGARQALAQISRRILERVTKTS